MNKKIHSIKRCDCKKNIICEHNVNTDNINNTDVKNMVKNKIAFEKYINEYDLSSITSTDSLSDLKHGISCFYTLENDKPEQLKNSPLRNHLVVDESSGSDESSESDETEEEYKRNLDLSILFSEENSDDYEKEFRRKHEIYGLKSDGIKKNEQK